MKFMNQESTFYLNEAEIIFYQLNSFLNHRGPQIVKLYESTGKFKEAEDLKEKLKTALEAKEQLEKIATLDFDKPSQHLKEMAEKMKFFFDFFFKKTFLALICWIRPLKLNL